MDLHTTVRGRAARHAVGLAGAALLAGGVAISVAPHPVHAAGTFTMSTGAALPTSDGGTEPRVTSTPDGKHYAISNTGGTATVWESDDGVTGWHVTGAIANQTAPTIDVDLVSMPAGSLHPGRLIAVELDSGGLNFRMSFSDDGGVTWTSSGIAPADLNALPGGELADQDRPWLATGPGDRAYLLFHNLLSGTVTHNMWVETSTDDGANFGAPVPVTQPGSQAWTDLQCADSGGPSNIFTNPTNGRVYVVWGSRGAQPAGGGCAASVTGPFEVNVVAATRVWVATAPATGATDPTQWTQSLAVDDLASSDIVGMQLAPGAIDSAGNVYILYPESVSAYPDYDGGAIKLVHASETDIVANPAGVTGATTNVWSTPVTVAPAGGAGHLLPHIVAGGPGEIDYAYFEGDEIPGAATPTSANWYLVAGQSLDATDPSPTFTSLRVNSPGSPDAPAPAYSGWTASQMMGACATGPTAGVQNGFACNRSTDVWGIGLDQAGKLMVSWPVAPASSFNCSTCNDTFDTEQTDGATILPPSGGTVPEAPVAPLLLIAGAGAIVAALRLRGRGSLPA